MDYLRPRSRSRDWRASLAKPLVQDQPQRPDITVWPNVVLLETVLPRQTSARVDASVRRLAETGSV